MGLTDWLQKTKEREEARIAVARVLIDELKGGYISILIRAYFQIYFFFVDSQDIY